MESQANYNLSPCSCRLLEPKTCVRLDCGRQATEPIGFPGEGLLLTYQPGEGNPTRWLLDFGQKVAGQLILDFEDSTGDNLLIRYGPTPETLLGFRSITLPGGSGRWVDPEFSAFRYLELELASRAIPKRAARVSLKRVTLRFTAYPFHYRGSFESDDSLLNRAWFTGAYTVQLCTQPESFSGVFAKLERPVRELLPITKRPPEALNYVIWDGPRRDREVWVGDLRLEALVLYYAFDNPDPVRNSLRWIADLQRGDGFIPGSGTTQSSYVSYMPWWVVALWEYALYTGDTGFLREMYPRFKAVMDYLLTFCIDERGLFRVDRSWTWSLPRSGCPGDPQWTLYKALLDAAAIEEVVSNDMTSVTFYRNAATELQKRIDEYYWSEELGVYLEQPSLCQPPQDTGGSWAAHDTNVMALLFGDLGVSRARRILSYLMEKMWTPYGAATSDRKLPLGPEAWAHNRQIWPYMNAYEVEARFRWGDSVGAFELMRRCWGNMLARGATAFWELVEATDGSFPTGNLSLTMKEDTMASYAHGWSGGITYLLPAQVLGVQPTRIGFSAARITPHPGVLRRAAGTIPTPHGPIRVTFEQEDALSFSVDVPEPIEAKMILPVDALQPGRPVWVNGRRVWDGKEPVEGPVDVSYSLQPEK